MNEKVGLAMPHHFRLHVDTTALTAGRHSISVRVSWPGGETVEEKADLTVTGE